MPFVILSCRCFRVDLVNSNRWVPFITEPTVLNSLVLSRSLIFALEITPRVCSVTDPGQGGSQVCGCRYWGVWL